MVHTVLTGAECGASGASCIYMDRAAFLDPVFCYGTTKGGRLYERLLGFGLSGQGNDRTRDVGSVQYVATVVLSYLLSTFKVNKLSKTKSNSFCVGLQISM